MTNKTVNVNGEKMVVKYQAKIEQPFKDDGVIYIEIDGVSYGNIDYTTNFLSGFTFYPHGIPCKSEKKMIEVLLTKKIK